MSKKHRPQIPQPFVAADDPAPITMPNPPPHRAIDGEPSPPRPIIHCSHCFFGRDRINNARICRASRPDTRYRSSQYIEQRGTRPLAEALWPEVSSDDWCGQGTTDGWPVVRP